LLTHNFKNAIVNNLAIGYSNYYSYAESSLYFTDMKGVKRRIHCSSRDCHVSLNSLFYGSIGVSDTTANRAIKDYDNIEDMIASRNFWLYGGRKYYSTEGDSHNWISGGGMIILGSGDTPPTPDDYCLDSWIPTTDLKIVTYGAISCKGYDDDIIGGLWGAFYNYTNENITVKEIGIIVDSLYYQDNSSIHTKYLLGREVFENPVIIKPQEGCTFNFTIK
jgi:hypothetical protein